jgi:hypothetical protein
MIFPVFKSTSSTMFYQKFVNWMSAPAMKLRTVDGRNKSGHESMRTPHGRAVRSEDEGAVGSGA